MADTADTADHRGRTAWLAASWAAVLLLPVPDAAAQAIYKCVVRGKPPSYQSEPCATNARVAAVRPYQPEPVPSAQDLQARRDRERRARQDSAYLSTLAGTTGRAVAPSRGAIVPVGSGQCEATKRERDAWERRVGLNRTIDALRAWNDRVYAACR